MRIIIAGADETGKSTTARILSSTFNVPVHSFATELRKFCVEEGFLTKEEAFSKPTTEKARLVLRIVGNAVRRVRLDYWTGKLAVSLVGQHWIIDDCRYVNEASWGMCAGGFLVYLKGDFDPTAVSFTELESIEKIAHLVIPAKSAPPEELAEKIVREMGL